MPNQKAALRLTCLSLLSLTFGCSNGSGPQPTSSTSNAECTPQQGQTANQQAGASTQFGQGTAPATTQSGNQTTAAATTTGSGGVYTLQASGQAPTYTLWGTPANTSAAVKAAILGNLDKDPSEVGQAVDAFGALLAYESGAGGATQAGNTATTSNTSGVTGMNNSSNSTNSNPCL